MTSKAVKRLVKKVKISYLPNGIRHIDLTQIPELSDADFTLVMNAVVEKAGGIETFKKVTS